jgi:hypothetical protein
VVSCESSNEASSSIKYKEFLDELNINNNLESAAVRNLKLER